MSEETTQIVWSESDEVYKPSNRTLANFLADFDVTPKVADETPTPIIFIDSDALAMMTEDSKRDVTREHGGVLLGEAFQDSAVGYYTAVHKVVSAPNTESSSIHLQFRPESWLSGVVTDDRRHLPADRRLVPHTSGPWCVSLRYRPEKLKHCSSANLGRLRLYLTPYALKSDISQDRTGPEIDQFTYRESVLTVPLRIKRAFNFKWLRFNFSRSGVGMSWGFPGLRFGVSSTGIRYLSLGIPGTGLYWIKYFRRRPASADDGVRWRDL